MWFVGRYLYVDGSYFGEGSITEELAEQESAQQLTRDHIHTMLRSMDESAREYPAPTDGRPCRNLDFRLDIRT